MSENPKSIYKGQRTTSETRKGLIMWIYCMECVWKLNKYTSSLISTPLTAYRLRPALLLSTILETVNESNSSADSSGGSLWANDHSCKHENKTSERSSITDLLSARVKYKYPVFCHHHVHEVKRQLAELSILRHGREFDGRNFITLYKYL